MRAITALLAIVVLTTCSTAERPESRSPVLLLAIDGLEWSVLQPLLDEGRLPAIAGLMERGTYGYLESMTPTLSPVIWTSVATGKQPRKHGILDFVYPERGPGGTERRYYTSGHRRTKAFWNILSDYQRTVHCIGWWMTYPAEPIRGVMVSQTNTSAPLVEPDRALWKGSLLKGVEGQVYPRQLQNRVMELLEETDRSLDRLTERIFGRPAQPPDAFAQLMWDQTQWAFRADATYLGVALDLLRSGEPFDVMALYIGGPDVVGHRFWRYAYPEQFADPPPAEQIANFHEVIDDYYVYVDGAIGELIEAAGRGLTVLIVSDHGMEATNTERRFDVASPPRQRVSGFHWNEPPGVLIAAGAGIRRLADGERARLHTLGSVLDVAPTLLHLQGIPLGRDMDGAPMLGVLEPQRVVEPRYVETHDDPHWLAAREGRVREAVDQAERLEQLRALGYIE